MRDGGESLLTVHSRSIPRQIDAHPNSRRVSIASFRSLMTSDNRPPSRAAWMDRPCRAVIDTDGSNTRWLGFHRFMKVIRLVEGGSTMRRLIMCCDGTWDTPSQLAVTNVRRMYNALADSMSNGEEQLAQYQSGVGTESGELLGWLLGGTTGAGLSSNVMAAYHWLTSKYRPGDKIALFGFSRGAYTARSTAGMIAACGLIDTRCVDEDTVRRQIRQVYQRRYHLGQAADPRWSDGLRFSYAPERDPMPVDFIGVWDTVGSLGIPDTLGGLSLLDPARRYAFLDVKLNPAVRHGRHAIALDEQRSEFTPTLWSEPEPDQDVKQVWFPGSHTDVGGGHQEKGLSDGALKWMIEEARAAIGVEFRKQVEDQIRPNALDTLHDDNQGIYGLFEPLYEPLLRPLLEPIFQPRPRATPMIDNDGNNPLLHSSVYERHQTPPIVTGPYRPTKMLTPGESSTVTVSARDPLNWTGLYLEAGDYTFAATGEWTDLGIRSGPAGPVGWRRFQPGGAIHLVGTLIGQAERLFRRVTRNPSAYFPLSRRDEDMPWMSLVGLVANDAIPLEGAQALHEQIAIGAGTNHRVCRPGYLYAFANNAWGFYGNNQGSVQLEVTRNS
ncbi:uncharacterized protein (DUF2235 family) [Nocardia sp. GAS34]|uniref:DUF2235 domain-containing protein n=1 Tax=Nocardia sp. GAS34 TaxID=3156305 RepID=UPI003D1CD7C4